MSYFDRFTAEHHDHQRDYIKHEPRPGDRDDSLPIRLQRPLTTAEDVALCVRGMKNLVDAAALIEQYANMIASCARVEEAQAAADRLAAMGARNAQA